MTSPTNVWLPLEGVQHDVAIEVLLRGPVSRKQLAHRLGVTAGTVTRAAQPLLSAGLLVEKAAQQLPGLGRPEAPLDLELQRDFFVGIKITAEGIHGVATTLRAQIVAEHTAPLPSLAADDVADQVAMVVDTLARQVPSVRAVGISLGGQVVDGTFVTQALLLGWNAVDFGALMRSRLEAPVVIDNDVLSLVRAERWFGAARDIDHFALLTIGAGLGYGLVAAGQLVEIPDSGLSPITHFPLDIGGGVCQQGHIGCAETLLTTHALRERARPVLGDDVGYNELLRLAPTNAAASAIVETAAFALGKLIAGIANLALPRKIILTGDGVELAFAGREALERGIAAHRNTRASPVDLQIQSVGFSEWARGAAATAIETFVVGRQGHRRH